MDQASPCPDGITPAHQRGSWWRGIAGILPLLILGGLLAAALLGVFGGGKARPIVVDSTAATLTVTTPRTLRNGEFFETRIAVTARRDIRDLVVAVSPELWRDMTVNTMIPAAGDEKFERGRYAFHYGALAAGATIAIKIDGQINPPLFAGTRGRIAILDGGREIVGTPVVVRVLP